MMTSAIHRVVTCFILTQKQKQPQLQPRIAIFHRCDTMPTFPSFWAGISGTIEANETPLEAANRELHEETSLTNFVVEEMGGLYVNVPYFSKRTNQERIIRVYPFVVNVPDTVSLELRGTEHDRYQFVSIETLQSMESQCVPGLLQAFHHATYGRYDSSISDHIRQWANDKENGASIMTQNALALIQNVPTSEDAHKMAQQIAMMRPSMVSIVNVMQTILQNKDTVTMESFQAKVNQCVTLGIQSIQQLVQEYESVCNTDPSANGNDKQFTVATFSRSGTLAKILRDPSIRNSCQVVCGQSTPGDEGELMAQDLNCPWIPDDELGERLTYGSIQLLLIGADCVLQDQVVNKVGTRHLCEIAKNHNVPVYCCADEWKVWDDIFPPPIESDLFELIPNEYITKLLIPNGECNAATG